MSPPSSHTCLLGPYVTQGVLPFLTALLCQARWKVICIDHVDNKQSVSQVSASISNNPPHIFTYTHETLHTTLQTVFDQHDITVVVIDPVLFNQPLVPLQAHSSTSLHDYMSMHLTPCVTITHAAAKYLTKKAQSNIIYLLPFVTIVHAGMVGQTHVSVVAGALRNLCIATFEDTRESNVKPTTIYMSAMYTAPAQSFVKPTQSTDAQLMSEYFRTTPDDAVQPADVARAVQYLAGLRRTAITNVLILQTYKQPVRYLHTYIKPNPTSKDITYAKHITQNATELGTDFQGDAGERRPYALITGASDGIGAEASTRLASMQYDIIIMARRRDRLDALAKQCQEKYKVRVLVYTVDVSNLSVFKQACTDAVQRWGTRHCRVLVGNAGLNKRRTIINSDPAMLDAVMTVNYTANQHLTTWFAPIMAANRTGTILYTNSLAVSNLVIGQAGTPSYYSSKFALAGFANSVYEDVREFGVQVSSLFVGLVNNALGNSPGPLQYVNDSGKAFIQNSDVADAVQYVVEQGAASKKCAATHLHVHLQGIVFPATLKLFDSVQSRTYQHLDSATTRSRM